MMGEGFSDINWRAAFIGFGVDWTFSTVVGTLVVAVMLAVKGVSLEADDFLPPDVHLASQVVGVMGALVGGIIAGYIARERGNLHGLLGSLIGLFSTLCTLPLLGGSDLDLGFVGFIILNLIGAWYGGGVGERWRARKDQE